MSFPRGVASLLDQIDMSHLAGIPARERSCVGAKFHSPTPLFVHEVVLPDERIVHLCGVCRDNLRLLTELQRVHAGPLPWSVRREFGNQLRSLVMSGKGSDD